MTYLEFLSWILSFGPKVPSLIASIQRVVMTIMEEAQNIRDILGLKTPETFKIVAPTAAEAAAEQEVIEAAMGGAETFGGPLQRILDFIRANPELIALLLSLFGKK